MLGPLQFTVHQDVPTVDAMHNPAIAFDQPCTPGGLRRVHGVRPVDPAIDNVRGLLPSWAARRTVCSNTFVAVAV